jgi:hypothetical protein
MPVSDTALPHTGNRRRDGAAASSRPESRGVGDDCGERAADAGVGIFECRLSGRVVVGTRRPAPVGSYLMFSKS